MVLDQTKKKLAIMEGTFAFHTLVHNHSFRNMDYTSKLLKKFHNVKFSHARIKWESIIIGVFNEYWKKILLEDLRSASFVSVLSVTSNHKEIKLYQILVRYLDIKSGIHLKILNLQTF